MTLIPSNEPTHVLLIPITVEKFPVGLGRIAKVQ
jgi:hypothetical protein